MKGMKGLKSRSLRRDSSARQLKNVNTYLVRGLIGALIRTLFNKVEVVQNAGSQSIVAEI